MCFPLTGAMCFGMAGADRGTAAAIMIDCVERSRVGGRTARRSASGMAGRSRGVGGLCHWLLPASEDADDLQEHGRGVVDRAGGGKLLVADGDDRAHRAAFSQHFVSRKVWDGEMIRDCLAGLAVEQVGDQQVVLVVDETGDAKSSIDCVGATCQHHPGASRADAADSIPASDTTSAALRRMLARDGARRLRDRAPVVSAGRYTEGSRGDGSCRGSV